MPANFHLLLCDGIKNLNMPCVKTTPRHTLICQPLFSEKVNFYSTLEDIIVKDRKREVVSQTAVCMLREKCYGHKLVSGVTQLGKAKSAINAHCTIFAEKRDKHFDYRVESRCFLWQVDALFIRLSALCVPRNFSYFDYDQFGSVYSTSALAFSEYIFMNSNSSGHTFSDMVYSIIAETIFVSRWLMGSTNKHCLPSSVNRLFANGNHHSVGCFVVPPVAQIVELAYKDHCDPKTILAKLCNAIKSIQGDLCQALLSVINIAYGERPAALLMNLYYKLLAGDNNALDPHASVPPDDSIPSLHFSRWLTINFEPKTCGRFNNVLRAGYSIMVKKYGDSASVAQAVLQTHLIEHNYNFVYTKELPAAPGTTNPVCRLIFSANVNVERARLVSMLDDCLVSIKAAQAAELAANNKRQRPTVRTSDAEFIRMIHGWFFYKGANAKVWSNCVYGFYVTRELQWIKNRRTYYNQHMPDEDSLRNILTAVRNWTPDSFQAEQLISYITQDGIHVSDYLADIIRRLWHIDAAVMRDNEFATRLQHASDLCLLETFLRPAQIRRLRNISREHNNVHENNLLTSNRSQQGNSANTVAVGSRLPFSSALFTGAQLPEAHGNSLHAPDEIRLLKEEVRSMALVIGGVLEKLEMQSDVNKAVKADIIHLRQIVESIKYDESSTINPKSDCMNTNITTFRDDCDAHNDATQPSTDKNFIQDSHTKQVADLSTASAVGAHDENGCALGNHAASAQQDFMSAGIAPKVMPEMMQRESTAPRESLIISGLDDNTDIPASKIDALNCSRTADLSEFDMSVDKLSNLDIEVLNIIGKHFGKRWFTVRELARKNSLGMSRDEAIAVFAGVVVHLVDNKRLVLKDSKVCGHTITKYKKVRSL